MGNSKEITNKVSTLLDDANTTQNSLLLKIILHCIIDYMSYVEHGESNQNSNGYKQWIKNHMIPVFERKKRRCIREINTNNITRDELAEAFWNDRNAKIHIFGHLTERGKKKEPKCIIKIDNYSADFMGNQPGKHKPSPDKKYILYLSSSEISEDLKDAVIETFTYLSSSTDTDILERIKKIKLIWNSRP